MGDASFSRWNTLFYWICIYIYTYTGADSIKDSKREFQ